MEAAEKKLGVREGKSSKSMEERKAIMENVLEELVDRDDTEEE